MNQEQLDSAGAKLLIALDKMDDSLDPREKDTGQVVRAIATLAIEFVSDIKRINEQLTNLNQAMAVVVDLLAAQYQNGVTVNVRAPIEIFSQEETEQKSDQEKGDYSREEADEAVEKAAYHDSV
jgi:hypothetical protein